MTSNHGLEPEQRARAVVAGHGDFAAGMISAVARICGQDACFTAFSNQGLCGDDLEQALRGLVDAADARVIFTDLPAGSATTAARRLQRARPELIVVTGVNVAVLLDFALKGYALSVEEAAAHAVERGRAAVSVIAPPAVAVAPPAPPAAPPPAPPPASPPAAPPGVAPPAAAPPTPAATSGGAGA